MPARFSLTLLACASALALAACKDDRPPAPAGHDFASAPPALVADNAPSAYRGYAPAERAHAFDRATYRAAPSYGFRYGEEEPWAWRTEDDYSMYAEPYDDGYRSYYYAPGGDYPYFIRDDDYGYGYGPDGVLIAIYDASGLLLPRERLYALAPMAGTYLVRASAIRRYALDDSYRVYVPDRYWAERAPRYYQTRETWYAAPERQPQWRAWRASHEREIARDLPRGDVRRWSKSDDRAWKAYEQADRRAWKAEDSAWRKAERREGRQVAVAAPPPAPIARAMRVERQDRDRQAGKVERREEPQRAMVEPRRSPERPEQEAHGPDRAQMATAEPRRGPERLERQAPEPERVRPEPPRPAREHGATARHAEPRQQVAADEPRPAPQRHEASGKPERAASPAAQAAQHGKGSGKPDRGKGHDKDQDKDRP